jgi:hypothetical protein
VLVHADRDADVVVAQANPVRAGLGCAGRRRAGIEHVGERNPGEPHHADDGVRVRHRPAAADRELDVLPLDAGVGERELYGVGGHLHRGLALEATEGMQPHPNDGDLV